MSEPCALLQQCLRLRWAGQQPACQHAGRCVGHGHNQPAALTQQRSGRRLHRCRSPLPP
jgi:hypothetical protein